MHPRSTDCEVNALTTTPSRPLKVGLLTRIRYRKRTNPGVGKLFSRRAALTIPRVVKGQGLLSRTAACYRRNCIRSQFCEIFLQCGISARKIGGVSKKKKKKYSPFRRR